MRKLIETHLGLVLTVACVLGLLIPHGGRIPDETLILLLATVTFLSCYKIDTPVAAAVNRRSILFCIARYAVLPLLLWVPASLLSADYALAVLLIALLPAGASSPALTHLFQGNVTLAFAVTLMSSALSVAVIPLTMAQIGGLHVAVNAQAIFGTLVVCLILPWLFYSGLRRNAPLRRFSERHGRLASILLVALIIFIVIAKQRDVILADPSGLIAPCLVALGCYLAFGLAGLVNRAPYPDRAAYGVCSLFNNAALGVSLALLYFGPLVTLTAVAAEIIWSLLPFPLHPLLERIKNSPRFPT